MARHRTLLEQHVQVRLPHTTAQTIVTFWDRVPAMYKGECNVKNCWWTSVMRMSRGDIETMIRDHHKEQHS
jgi:hypothetical protein